MGSDSEYSCWRRHSFALLGRLCAHPSLLLTHSCVAAAGAGAAAQVLREGTVGGPA